MQLCVTEEIIPLQEDDTIPDEDYKIVGTFEDPGTTFAIVHMTLSPTRSTNRLHDNLCGRRRPAHCHEAWQKRFGVRLATLCGEAAEVTNVVSILVNLGFRQKTIQNKPTSTTLFFALFMFPRVFLSISIDLR